MKNYILSLLLLTMAMSATAQISGNGSGISVNPVTPPVTGATAHLTDPSSYNISRGLDEISKGHYDKAVSYINKELEDDDENGQAYLLLSDIYYQQGQYGDALQNASNALLYLPHKQKSNIATAYYVRANVYMDLKDTLQAINELTAAIKSDPSQEKFYVKRGFFYNMMGKDDKSLADFKHLIKSKDTTIASMGYIGLGTRSINMKEYGDAATYYDKALELSSDPDVFSRAHIGKAISYAALHQIANAADEYITVLRQQPDRENVPSYLAQLADSDFVAVETRVRHQESVTINKSYWHNMLGILYEQTYRYRQAASCYRQTFAVNHDSVTALRLAHCYSDAGMPDSSLAYLDSVKSKDDALFKCEKIYMLGYAGRYAEASDTLTSLLRIAPDQSASYELRGFFSMMQRNYVKAMKDADMAVSLADRSPSALMFRAHLHLIMGDTAAALPDFKRAQPVLTDKMDGPLALYFLGDKPAALSQMESLLRSPSIKPDDIYSAVCFYSLINDTSKAVDCLSRALQMGYRKFIQIDNDPELDKLRKMPSFNQIIKEYRNK